MLTGRSVSVPFGDVVHCQIVVVLLADRGAEWVHTYRFKLEAEICLRKRVNSNLKNQPVSRPNNRLEDAMG